jgi:hypothetical protein
MLALYVTGIMDMSQVFLPCIWIQRADAVVKMVEEAENSRSPDPAGVIDQGFLRETPVKEQYTGKQECKGNKLSCQEYKTRVCLYMLS